MQTAEMLAVTHTSLALYGKLAYNPRSAGLEEIWHAVACDQAGPICGPPSVHNHGPGPPFGERDTIKITANHESLLCCAAIVPLALVSARGPRVRPCLTMGTASRLPHRPGRLPACEPNVSATRNHSTWQIEALATPRRCARHPWPTLLSNADLPCRHPSSFQPGITGGGSTGSTVALRPSRLPTARC